MRPTIPQFRCVQARYSELFFCSPVVFDRVITAHLHRCVALRKRLSSCFAQAIVDSIRVGLGVRLHFGCTAQSSYLCSGMSRAKRTESCSLCVTEELSILKTLLEGIARRMRERRRASMRNASSFVQKGIRGILSQAGQMFVRCVAKSEVTACPALDGGIPGKVNEGFGAD